MKRNFSGENSDYFILTFHPTNNTNSRGPGSCQLNTTPPPPPRVKIKESMAANGRRACVYVSSQALKMFFKQSHFYRKFLFVRNFVRDMKITVRILAR